MGMYPHTFGHTVYILKPGCPAGNGNGDSSAKANVSAEKHLEQLRKERKVNMTFFVPTFPP